MLSSWWNEILSFVAPILVIHSWFIVLFWLRTVHLKVKTISVCWLGITYWWDVLTYNQLEMVILEMRVWWSCSDSIHNSFSFVFMESSFYPQKKIIFYSWFYLSYHLWFHHTYMLFKKPRSTLLCLFLHVGNNWKKISKICLTTLTHSINRQQSFMFCIKILCWCIILAG